MKTFRDIPLSNVRVIGIFAHIDAGKTTTSEAILYYTGRIHRIGSVDAGDTQLDWMEQERARGITITAAATTCEWRGHRINLIDTPGHVDFSAEVVRSIRVIDGAVIVLCGVGGVETQTETVWRHADREGLARLIFVNKLDRSGADFDRVLNEVRRLLTPRAVALQIPIGSENDFCGVIDLLTGQALVWREGSEEPVREPIPPAFKEQAAAARATLLDAICETDERLLRQRLEGQGLPPAAYQAALRRATGRGQLVPVLCGSAKERTGIQPLLDAVTAYLPAPQDVPPVLGTVPGNPEQVIERNREPSDPLCAASFKIVADPHVGHLTWVRVFSGCLKSGEVVYNPRSGAKERVGRIYRMHANRRQQVDRMQSGDVMALVGVKSAVTGDTLCHPAYPIELETFAFPEPVITVALAAATPEERDRLRQAIGRLCEEDPTLLAGYDAETGEETLSGMGELHLEIVVDRMRSEFGLLVKASPPQVAYRETVQRTATASGDYRKQTGGHGHFAVVRLRVAPLERGRGIVFESSAPAAEVPANFVRPVEAGLREALGKGILAGYPVTDLQVTLLGGRFHEVDSNAMDFHIAASQAVRQAVRQAGPALLEPVMRADLQVSEAALGAVLADFTRRRGGVTDMRVAGPACHLVGEVPLAEARGYATALRDLTAGRGDFTLEFSHYALVPEGLAEAIVAERQALGKIPRR